MLLKIHFSSYFCKQKFILFKKDLFVDIQITARRQKTIKRKKILFTYPITYSIIYERMERILIHAIFGIII